MWINFIHHTSRVDRKGRVQIPYHIRQELDLKTGDELAVFYYADKRQLRILKLSYVIEEDCDINKNLTGVKDARKN